MEIIEDKNNTQYQIAEINQKSVTINNTVYAKSLIISARQLITDWPPQDISELSNKHWQSVIELKPEIVLLGTGRTFHFSQPELLQPLHEAHIGVEFMDTPAACRTYIALSSEGRNVVAALIIN